MVCDEPDASPKYGTAIVGRLKTFDTAKLTGNCWLEGSAYGAAHNDNAAEALTAASVFTSDKMGTGEVCFKLNGDAEVPAWYQTLTGDDKDLYPVLDPTHKVVLYDETNGYYNEGDEDPDGIENVNVNDNDNRNNAAIFNLAGQRISKLQKGINIVGGKKILY